MKTTEDEAFDELARKQGSWGGGFKAKQAMAADKLQEPWNEDEWRRNNWRCSHGWLRGEQCESCNAAQEPPSEWAGIKAILDEYGLQAIDFVADFKAALALPAQEPVVDKGFPWTQKHVATPQVFGAMPSNIPPPQPAQEPPSMKEELTKIMTDSYDQGIKDALETIVQLIKELRPAIRAAEVMGKGKPTEEWFDILAGAIKEKNK